MSAVNEEGQGCTNWQELVGVWAEERTEGHSWKVLNSPRLGGNQWDLLHIKGLFGIINEEKDFAELLNYLFFKIFSANNAVPISMLDLFSFQDKKAHELSERETLGGGTLEQTDKLNSSLSKGPRGYICKGLESIWNWSGCADSKNTQVVTEVRYCRRTGG